MSDATTARFEAAYANATVSPAAPDMETDCVLRLLLERLHETVPNAEAYAVRKVTATICGATRARPGLKWVTHTVLVIEPGCEKGGGGIARCSRADITELVVSEHGASETKSSRRFSNM